MGGTNVFFLIHSHGGLTDDVTECATEVALNRLFFSLLNLEASADRQTARQTDRQKGREGIHFVILGVFL